MNIKKSLLTKIKRILGENFYSKLRTQVLYILSHFLRDHGYDDKFFKEQERLNGRIYKLLAKAILSEFKNIKTLADIGCGCGGISKAFKDAGVKKIYAYDYSSAAIRATKQKGIKNVKQIDLIKIKEINIKTDLCLCFEVLEHIPEKYASHVCKLLSTISPLIIITAAPPGQGGYLHINEKPKSYWIKKMKQLSYSYDSKAVRSIRKRFKGKMIIDYDRNLMVFRKRFSKI